MVLAWHGDKTRARPGVPSSGAARAHHIPVVFAACYLWLRIEVLRPEARKFSETIHPGSSMHSAPCGRISPDPVTPQTTLLN